MPQTINGIGTWYYGKRNIHRLRNVCSQCGAVGDLESYDTSLYFVVFFVPLIPLARRRVLEACPSCNRHRMVPLKEWQRTKEANVAAALEKHFGTPEQPKLEGTDLVTQERLVEGSKLYRIYCLHCHGDVAHGAR